MKGIIYYTHHLLREDIALVCRRYMKQAGLPIVSVSHYPIDMGENHVVDWSPNLLTMFKQILLALEKSTAEIIFFCEHDVLYHPSHFDFVPEKNNVYYYNLNVWHLDSDTGKALTYDRMKMVSGMCSYRDIVIDHYSRKIKRIEAEGFSRRRSGGFEPGKIGPLEPYGWKAWRSELPNINIKHGLNVTKKRFKLEQYRCRDRIKDSWVLADDVPYWGKTKGRFNQFLREL
jgi:hypothetical protein